MEEIAPVTQKAGYCPSCGAAVRWYHVLISSAVRSCVRCPSCKTWLRLCTPGQLVVGVSLAAVAAVIVLLAGSRLGFLHGDTHGAFFGRLLAIAVVAGVSGGLAFTAYIVYFATFLPMVPGEPVDWRRKFTFGLAMLGLVVVTAGGTILAMVISPVPLFPLGMLRTPQFPTGSDLPVLGRADPAWKLQTLDGKEVAFASLQGRPVFLNLWATWCPPCVAEVPSIQRLHESLKSDDVAVVLVTHEPLQKVRTFVEQKGWAVPVYVASEVPEVFQSEVIPATFILNRRGEVVYRQLGSADWDTDDCRQFLRGLP